MKRSFVKIHRSFFLPGVFCIAMGILEAIVVVYLRRIYYPGGFDFPLSFLSPEMVAIEWLRESSTIVMLVVLGVLTGKDNMQRFFYFLFSFGVWDLTYYAGLKLFLDWPSSFLTWDILFLIPVPWVSPVLAPLICSVTMILLALSGIYLQENGHPIRLKIIDWGLLVLGALIIFYSFTQDYINIIVQKGLFSKFWTLSENTYFYQIVSQYTPAHYNWYLFSLGEILILYVLIRKLVESLEFRV